MAVQISLRVPAFNFGGYIPRCGIAGSHSNSICNFFGSRHTVFQSACTILHPQQLCVMVPIFLHPYQLFLLGFFFFSLDFKLLFYLFIQSTLAQRLPYTRCWGYSEEQDRCCPPSRNLPWTRTWTNSYRRDECSQTQQWSALSQSLSSSRFYEHVNFLS